LKNRIRNLLFDLGNVIVDIDVDGAHDRLGKLFRSDVKGEITDKAFLDYESGKISTDIFINTLLSQCDHRVQAIDIIEAWNSMLTGVPPHRLEMLTRLKTNYSVYILSNTNAMHLEWINRYVKKAHHAAHFDNRYFDHAYYSHEVGDRKPNASIFKFIIEDAFMTPALTLYMDDMQENLDVAQKLGFQTYLVKPGEEIAEYLKLEGFY